MRILPSTMLLCALSGPLAGQAADRTGDEAPALATLTLDHARLAEWGVRVYDYALEQGDAFTSLGSVRMETRLEADTLTLSDHWELRWNGAPLLLDVTQTGPARGLLRPTTLAAAGNTDDGDGSTFAATGAVDADTLTLNEEGKAPRERPFPSDTVTDIALFRLVTLLPREPGFAARIGHVLEVSEFNLKADFVVRYAGRELVEAADGPRELHRFDVAGRRETSTACWVDDAGDLQVVLLDGRKRLVARPGASLQNVKRLMQVTNAGAMGVATMEQMFAALAQSFPTAPDELWERLRARHDPAALDDLIAPLYSRHFSDEEVVALIGFYETPLGAKLIATLPTLLGESMQVGQEWGQRMAQDLLEELSKEGYR